MEIERTFDVDFIIRCVTHPANWKWIADDGAPEAGMYFPPLEEATMWVKVEDYGVFLLVKQNHIMHEVHTVLLPEAHGKAVEIGKAALAWAFEHTDAKRIITNVPTFNPLALRLAKRVGFEQFGVNTKSYQKDGVLYDQWMLGIDKGEMPCQQSS